MLRPVSYIALLMLSFLLGSLPCFSQKSSGKITGLLLTDSTRQKITDATITLLNESDSTMEKMTVADNSGRFTLNGIPLSRYRLIITEIGHEPLIRPLTLTPEQPHLDLDTLYMKILSNSLDVVTIVRQLPIVFKQDTVEFNAGSFKTKDHDMAEDLLKKLPGLEVARDGTITANGEKVTRILVDGKPFFGDDPKVATQNLPVNVIDKIQVIDEKSDQSKMTKVQDGQVEKVINITIKKEKKRGNFGQLHAGYGTSERYEASANAHHFTGDKRASIIAGSSNTGRFDNAGGGNSLQNNFNSNGLSEDQQVRGNLSDSWGKDLTGSVNVGYTRNQNSSVQERNRQTVQDDSTNILNELNRSERLRSGFNGGLRVEYKRDSTVRVMVDQSFNVSWFNSSVNSVFASTVAAVRKLNEGSRDNSSKAHTPAINGSVSISRMLKKQRRGIFFNFSDNFNTNFTDGFNRSYNYFYPLDSAEYNEIINQFNGYKNRSYSINSSLSYNEPVGKKTSLSFSTGYNRSRNNSARAIFDYNLVTGDYDLFDPFLSNRFNNFSTLFNAGTNFNYVNKGNSLSVGAVWQKNRTVSESVDNDSVYQQVFSGIVPRLSYTYFKRGKKPMNLTFSYNFENRAPQALQLQPVIDISNPLYLRYGNPNLKYSTTHRFAFNGNRSNQRTGFNINAGGNLNLTTNSIATATRIDKTTGVQTSMPVNAGSVYNGNGRLYLSRLVNLFGLKNRVFTSLNSNFSKGISFIDGEQNISRSEGYNFNGGFSFDYKEFLSFRFSYGLNAYSVHYSLRKQQDNRNTMTSVDAYIRISPTKKTDLALAWDHNANRGQSAGFNRRYNLVNAEMNQYFGKKRNVWLKLVAFDLLKQNINIYRTTSDYYFEDVKTNSLGRYFLLSLNWRFNKFGK